MSSLKFGTSGVRGLVTELVGVPAYSYARAFCAMIIEDGAAGTERRVLIGRDLRSSSLEISYNCAQAVADAGLVPSDAGEVPTPALALAAKMMGAPAIMVTGSHIPDDRNGLKFYRSLGEIDKADEARIATLQTRLASSCVTTNSVKPATVNVLSKYYERYLSFFEPNILHGLTIGVYEHSTVGRDVLLELIDLLGADAVPLGRSHRFIPVDTEALRAEDVTLVRGWAADREYDAIVSADGDADRPLIADEKGSFLRGDLVGALTAFFLEADAIVTPVTSNSTLERSDRYGRVLRTKVGSPFVIAGIEEAQSDGAHTIVGFEANGGTLVGSDIDRNGRRLSALPTRDAVLPILAVLALMNKTRKPLSAIVVEQRFAVARSNRLQSIPSEISSAFIAKLADHASRSSKIAFLGHGGIASRDQRDGLRLTLADGLIVHFRASGNAPELRIYTEADGVEAADALLQEGIQFAKTEMAV